MNIVGFVMAGTNDLEKSREFYDAVLVHLELKKLPSLKDILGTATQMMTAVKFILLNLMIKIMPQLVMEQWLHYLLYQKML